jgi:hypothetical protein
MVLEKLLQASFPKKIRTRNFFRDKGTQPSFPKFLGNKTTYNLFEANGPMFLETNGPKEWFLGANGVRFPQGNMIL